ncbi:MAG TPA: FHA domain-containing protein [Polyangiaceae bacterium]
MALTFVVLSGNPSEQLPLTLDGPRIVVGRSEAADLRLPDLSVSARHASFRQRGGEYLIVDEGSTNGTFVGPVRLSPQAPRVIRSGDKVRFGRLWVEVNFEALPAAVQSKHAAKDLALMLVAESLLARGEPAQATLEIKEGPDAGTSLALEEEERRYSLGRSSSNDVALEEANASRRHAEVFRRNGRIYARDLGSKNGTLLAGLPLPSKFETVWATGTKLQIGADVIVLDDPLATALVEVESQADEVMSGDEDVPMPSSTTEGVPNEQSPSAPQRERVARRSDPSGISSGDWFVALIALAVIGISLFGLYWLLGRK